MIKGVIIKRLNKHEDGRGWLAEIFRQDEDNFLPVMSYVSLTRPGAIRGPHEHIKQTDRFVFVGPGDFELYLWDRRENSETKGENMKTKVGASSPALVVVPPGVVHGYKCVSVEGGLCINLPDELYKGEGKIEEVDEIRWEDRQDSLYKIA